MHQDRRCSPIATFAARRRPALAAALLAAGLAAPAAAQQAPPPVVKTLPGRSAVPPPALPPATGPVVKALPPQAQPAPPTALAPSAGTPYAAALALPAALGGFSRGEITDFEPRSPGLGAAARYTLPGRALRADIFLYDRGLRVPITEASDAGPVREEFERTIREVLGFYRHQNREATHTGSVALPDGLLCAEFDVATATGPRDYSLACLAGAAGRFMKLRLTMPQAADASAIGRGFAREAMFAARGMAPPAAAGPASGLPGPGGRVSK